MILRILTYVSGIGLLAFGVWSFVDVSAFERLYGFDTTEPSVRIALRAGYGGFEWGFAALTLCGGVIGLTLRQRAWIALAGYFFLALARLIAALIDWPPPSLTYTELGIEFGLAALLGLVLYFHRAE